MAPLFACVGRAVSTSSLGESGRPPPSPHVEEHGQERPGSYSPRKGGGVWGVGTCPAARTPGLHSSASWAPHRLPRAQDWLRPRASGSSVTFSSSRCWLNVNRLSGEVLVIKVLSYSAQSSWARPWRLFRAGPQASNPHFKQAETKPPGKPQRRQGPGARWPPSSHPGLCASRGGRFAHHRAWLREARGGASCCWPRTPGPPQPSSCLDICTSSASAWNARSFFFFFFF